MKIVFLVLLSSVLVACTANQIKGEWYNEDGQSQTFIRFSGKDNCFIYVGGSVDGMAFECKYRKVNEKSFELWFLDESGNTEEGYYFSFTYDKESDVVSVNTQERIIVLHRK